MKKLYSLLLVILFAAGLSQARAEEFSVTLKWDKPDAVEFKYGGTSLGASQNVVLEVPQGATDYVFTATTKAKPLFVAAKEGFKIIKATCVSAQGASSNIAVSNLNGVTYLRLNLSAWNSPLIGGTVTIETEALQTASSFTVKVNDCLDKIKKVYLEPSKKEITLTNGSNTAEFTPGQDQSLTIEVTDRLHPEFYTVTLNGTAVAFDTESQCFVISPLAANDVLEISYTNTNPVETVTVEFPEGLEGCIQSLYDTSAFQAVTLTDGKFQVEQGHRVRVIISEDFLVKTVTFNGETVAEWDGEEGVDMFSFVVSASGVLAFEGSAKVYEDITYTAYVVCPEGLKIVAGNLLTGYFVTLADGEPITEDIVLPALGKPAQPAYTMKPGEAQKFTFTVSEKYGDLNILPQEGYWIRTQRNSAKTFLDLPTTDSPIYIVAEKIEDDAKANIFVSMPADRKMALDANTMYGCMQGWKYADGWSELSFDKDYMSPFSARVQGEQIDPTFCFYNGESVSADEYGKFALPLADGDVVKFFADGKSHSSDALTVTNLHGAVEYEKTPDNFVTYTDGTKLVDGTEVKITVANGYTLKVDGTEVTLTDGAYSFAASGAPQTIEFIPGDEILTAVLTPESGSTLPELTEILVSFPLATSVELAGMDISEITLVGAGNVWGNISSQTEIEKVEGADVPTFVVKFLAAPTINTSYTFIITEGFFKVDGADSKQIMGTYVLEKEGDVNYMFNPDNGFFNATDPYLTIGVVFPDDQVSEGENYAAIKVTFDGVELTDADYFGGAMENFYMIMFNSALNKEGVLTIDIPAGALSLSGKPNPAIKNSWTAVIPSEFTMEVETKPTANPNDIHQIDEITVSFPGAKTVTRFEDAAINLRLKPDWSKPGSQAWSATAVATEVEGADVPTFKLTWDKLPTEFGDYILTIPDGAFTIDGVASSEYFTKTYSLTTGVADITVDGAADNAVFNLQGIALDCEWDELPAGFYIRGGKVVLKK